MYKNIIIILIAVLSMFSLILAGSKNINHLRKSENYTKPFGTVYNINNLSGWVYANGISGPNPKRGMGIHFPRSKVGILYFEGILWGGYVQDGQGDNPRVNGQRYGAGTHPGHVIKSASYSEPGEAYDPYGPRARIYRIRKDYLSMSDDDVRADAADIYMKKIEEVTELQMDSIRQQYATDWAEWPWDLGAPFYDHNDNEIYEPDLGESPGLQNADQVIWFVCNDLDIEKSQSFLGCLPTGIEMQVTIWGFKAPPFDNVIYKRYRLFNKAAAEITDMFAGCYLDADIGEYTDDFSGCDSILNVSYSYNGFSSDSWYDEYDMVPPSLGHALIQGPLVDSPGDSAIFNFKKVVDKKNLGMTSHYVSASGSPMSDPSFDREGGYEFYNTLRGYTPTADLDNPIPFYIGSGPDRGKPTRFPLSGDPILKSGDIDGHEYNFPPGDRQTMFSTGPFYMNAGESQEFIIAMVAASNPEGTNLISIFEMKQKIKLVKAGYRLDVWSNIDKQEKSTLPGSFELKQNFPNPFNPNTTFQFILPKKSRVTLAIYDIVGRKLVTLVDRVHEFGDHEITWDGLDDTGLPLSSGLYIYRIDTGDYTRSRKMILLK